VHQVSGFKGVPERIAQHLPDVRLIYVVRDPIERIRSHYQHRVLSGAVPPALPARARAPGDVRTASLVPSRDAAIRLRVPGHRSDLRLGRDRPGVLSLGGERGVSADRLVAPADRQALRPSREADQGDDRSRRPASLRWRSWPSPQDRMPNLLVIGAELRRVRHPVPRQEDPRVRPHVVDGRTLDITGAPRRWPRLDRRSGGVDAYVSGTARFTEPNPAAAR